MSTHKEGERNAFEYVYMPNGDINRMKTAKKVVAEFMGDLGRGGHSVSPDDIYTVWFCKTLQNWKALLSTDVVNTGIYFEVTFNGDKNELYLDHYKKVFNGVYSNVI
jgi:Family of unknown function (DUF6275)